MSIVAYDVVPVSNFTLKLAHGRQARVQGVKEWHDCHWLEVYILARPFCFIPAHYLILVTMSHTCYGVPIKRL